MMPNSKLLTGEWQVKKDWPPPSSVTDGATPLVLLHLLSSALWSANSQTLFHVLFPSHLPVVLPLHTLISEDVPVVAPSGVGNVHGLALHKQCVGGCTCYCVRAYVSVLALHKQCVGRAHTLVCVSVPGIALQSDV
eukprot:1161488-Pelagomonas_calceolata.AAC.4